MLLRHRGCLRKGVGVKSSVHCNLNSAVVGLVNTGLVNRDHCGDAWCTHSVGTACTKGLPVAEISPTEVHRPSCTQMDRKLCLKMKNVTYLYSFGPLYSSIATARPGDAKGHGDAKAEKAGAIRECGKMV